jgi:hypothetical protein
MSTRLANTTKQSDQALVNVPNSKFKNRADPLNTLSRLWVRPLKGCKMYNNIKWFFNFNIKSLKIPL